MTLEFRCEWHDFADSEEECMNGYDPMELATLAALEISANGHCLSESHDEDSNESITKPHLAAYYIAKWLASNWWRLRWEGLPVRGRSARHSDRRLDWGLAHGMASIGAGFNWPNVTIWSDKDRIVLSASPDPKGDRMGFWYTAKCTTVVPAKQFEKGVDAFVEAVIDRLGIQGLKSTNLHQIWKDVKQERDDRELGYARKMEALLGEDPGTISDEAIKDLKAGDKKFGKKITEELASDGIAFKKSGGVTGLEEIVASRGADVSLTESVAPLDKDAIQELSKGAAWHLGRESARRLRRKEKLGDGPLKDKTLADLSGVTGKLLEPDSDSVAPVGCVMVGESGRGRAVLQRPDAEGRRFELGRLIGDRFMSVAIDKHLYPATGAYTFSQRAQRAFSAELLCPAEEVVRRLDGANTQDARASVAKRYRVSAMVVKHQRENFLNSAPTRESDFNGTRVRLAA